VISDLRETWSAGGSEFGVGNRAWEGCDGTYIVMKASLFRDHTIAHVESVEEDARGCQR
jgi:hypothetical protein